MKIINLLGSFAVLVAAVLLCASFALAKPNLSSGKSESINIIQTEVPASPAATSTVSNDFVDINQTDYQIEFAIASLSNDSAMTASQALNTKKETPQMNSFRTTCYSPPNNNRFVRVTKNLFQRGIAIASKNQPPLRE